MKQNKTDAHGVLMLVVEAIMWFLSPCDTVQQYLNTLQAQVQVLSLSVKWPECVMSALRQRLQQKSKKGCDS